MSYQVVATSITQPKDCLACVILFKGAPPQLKWAYASLQMRKSDHRSLTSNIRNHGGGYIEIDRPELPLTSTW